MYIVLLPFAVRVCERLFFCFAVASDFSNMVDGATLFCGYGWHSLDYTLKLVAMIEKKHVAGNLVLIRLAQLRVAHRDASNSRECQAT